jgi:hypothetical protein
MHKYILPLLVVSVLAGCAHPSEKTKIVNHLIKATESNDIQWVWGIYESPKYDEFAHAYKAFYKGQHISFVRHDYYPHERLLIFIDDDCMTINPDDGNKLHDIIYESMHNTLKAPPKFMKGE